MHLLQRFWINQPSIYQDWHNLHGRNVLIDFGEITDTTVTVYFTDGPVVSAVYPVSKIASICSKGWK